MSMVHRLIDQLKQRGLSIERGAEPGQLLLCGPSAEKTPEVIDAVKKFKPALLSIYAPDAAPAPREAETAPEAEPAADDSEGERCDTCSAVILTTGPDLFRMCRQVTCPHWTPEAGPEWVARERGVIEYRARQAN